MDAIRIKASARTLELQGDLAQHRQAALAIAQKALGEDRELTTIEKEAADQHLVAVEHLQRAVQKANDNDLRAFVADLGRGVDLGDHMRVAPDGRRVSKAGSWSSAVEKALWRGGSKALPTSGTANIPVPDSQVWDREAKIPSLLSVIPRVLDASTAGYSYLRETSRTLAAEAVAEGAVKPESEIVMERQDERATTIATIGSPQSRQNATDFSLLGGYLDRTLRLALIVEIEDQLINGSGAGANLEGLLNLAGVWVQAWDTDIFTTTRKAISVLEIDHVTPTCFVLSVEDWEAIELEATTTGAFLFKGADGDGPPVSRAARRLWGVPVAVTTELAEGVGLVMDSMSLGLYEYQEARLDWSEATYEDGHTDFVKNQLRFRAETRLGFAKYRPASICTIDMSAGS